MPQNAVVHLILGMWMDDWGMELSETLHITDKGCVRLCDFPQHVHVIDDVDRLERTINLLADLVAFPTVSGEPNGEVMGHQILGVAWRQRAADVTDDGQMNLFATIGPGRWWHHSVGPHRCCSSLS